ncbi:MAG TPA: hypothetical protein VK694_00160 [Verrucomicrobiae bacterium]|nr:hypothetical protein [Verrucomicrobiae bacterium]
MSVQEAETGAVTTSIHTYVHREYENQVDVIGAIHVAQLPYYEAIQGLIDSKHDDNGAVVHYEQIIKNTPEEFQQAGRAVRARAECVRVMMRGVYGLFGDLEEWGLVKQTSAITLRDDWQNYDATEIDLARRLSSFALRRHTLFVRGMKWLYEDMDPEERQKMVKEALMDREERPFSPRILKLLIGDLSKQIVDYRNDIELEAVDGQIQDDPETDMVLLWGEGHLKGLGQGLLGRGFVKVDEDKLVAMD